MKKNTYWNKLRAQLSSSGREPEGNVYHVNDHGLAKYAYLYWQHHGVLPLDFEPIAGKEECGDVSRWMWEIAEKDPAFQSDVLDVIEKEVLNTDEKRDWHTLSRTDVGPFFSAVEAPQLRRMYQYFLIRDSSDHDNPVMFLCMEYCVLAAEAQKYGQFAQAKLNNADILSLISGSSAWTTKDVEVTLETFERVRRSNRRNESSPDDDIACFNRSIRPLLLGILQKQAKSFGDWKKIFYFEKDIPEKMFALFHLSSKAKTLVHVVNIFECAKSVNADSLAESARLRWKEMCQKMEAEDLAMLSSKLMIDPEFVHQLVLAKCED